MQKYYTGKEIAKGITIDGIEIFPPISEVTLRNARMNRTLSYTRISRICYYQTSWIQAFIDRNIVQVKTN